MVVPDQKVTADALNAVVRVGVFEIEPTQQKNHKPNKPKPKTAKPYLVKM